MFNKKLKNDSIENLKDAKRKYDSSFEQLINEAERLQNSRKILKNIIDDSWNIINKIKNKPEELDTKTDEILASSEKYNELLSMIEKEIKDIDVKSSESSGVGVATLGGPALTSLAMAVGTTSTGATIGGLSGIAATNAALAWLGGGSLAAGGAGVFGGEAILGLMGPIGWAIGGATLVGTGVLANHKNKDLAEKEVKQYEDITAAKLIIDDSKKEVLQIEYMTTTTINKLMTMSSRIGAFSRDYINLTENDKMILEAFINNVLSGAKLLNKVIKKNQENVDEI